MKSVLFLYDPVFIPSENDHCRYNGVPLKLALNTLVINLLGKTKCTQNDAKIKRILHNSGKKSTPDMAVWERCESQYLYSFCF
jgi:hypothetical protein